jgi:hypothetical protein
MDGTYPFVSPLLKKRSEASPFKYLRFAAGLSELPPTKHNRVVRDRGANGR